MTAATLHLVRCATHSPSILISRALWSKKALLPFSMVSRTLGQFRFVGPAVLELTSPQLLQPARKGIPAVNRKKTAMSRQRTFSMTFCALLLLRVRFQPRFSALGVFAFRFHFIPETRIPSFYRSIQRGPRTFIRFEKVGDHGTRQVCFCVVARKTQRSSSFSNKHFFIGGPPAVEGLLRRGRLCWKPEKCPCRLPIG